MSNRLSRSQLKDLEDEVDAINGHVERIVNDLICNTDINRLDDIIGILEANARTIRLNERPLRLILGGL